MYNNNNNNLQHNAFTTRWNTKQSGIERVLLMSPLIMKCISFGTKERKKKWRGELRSDKVVLHYVCNIRELISFSFSGLLDIKVICWRVQWESIWRGCVYFTTTMHTQYKFISVYIHIHLHKHIYSTLISRSTYNPTSFHFTYLFMYKFTL